MLYAYGFEQSDNYLLYLMPKLLGVCMECMIGQLQGFLRYVV